MALGRERPGIIPAGCMHIARAKCPTCTSPWKAFSRGIRVVLRDAQPRCVLPTGSIGWERLVLSSPCCSLVAGGTGWAMETKSCCFPLCFCQRTCSFVPSSWQLHCPVCSVARAAIPVLSGDEVGCTPVTSAPSVRTGLEQWLTMGGCWVIAADLFYCLCAFFRGADGGGILRLMALSYLLLPSKS